MTQHELLTCFCGHAPDVSQYLTSIRIRCLEHYKDGVYIDVVGDGTYSTWYREHGSQYAINGIIKLPAGVTPQPDREAFNRVATKWNNLILSGRKLNVDNKADGV